MAAGATEGLRRYPTAVAAVPGERGFTLMELLVVMLLIGIIASFAVFNITRDPKDLVLEEANRLKALIQLASDEAVLQSREFALQFHKDGYRFLRLDSDGEGNWQWTELVDDPVFRVRCLEDPVRMQVMLEGEDTELDPMHCKDDAPQADSADEEGLQAQTPVYPRVFLLSSGEMTPFEVDMPVEGSDQRFRLVGQIQGTLKLYYPGDKDDDQG